MNIRRRNSKPLSYRASSSFCWSWATISPSSLDKSGCVIGTEWYRVDLVFFHRRLRALVIVDLKLGKFTHADAGQMNLYLKYAREHWTHPHENPPVGLILCSEKDAAVAHYALGNLANQVLAREYQLNLPNEAEIAARIDTARRLLSADPGRLEPPDE